MYLKNWAEELHELLSMNRGVWVVFDPNGERVLVLCITFNGSFAEAQNAKAGDPGVFAVISEDELWITDDEVDAKINFTRK